MRVAQTRDERARFWILTKAELQKICVKAHSDYLQRHDGLRPKNPESCHLTYSIDHLQGCENNWQLIRKQMEQQVPQADPLAMS